MKQAHAKRLDALEREPPRKQGGDPTWLLDKARPLLPELVARVEELLSVPERDSQALAVAFVDLIDALPRDIRAEATAWLSDNRR